jgi:cell filamentation protein
MSEDDPYLIAGTRTLRNLRGITDHEELARFEFQASFVRLTQIYVGGFPGPFDLDHFCAFHHHIFQDVYSWSGELRTVEITKNQTHFTLVPFLLSAASDIFDRLADVDLRGSEREPFVATAAQLLGDINGLHLFREGNGRAQRAFLSELARHAGYDVQWERVDAARNTAASIASAAGDPWPMHRLLGEITVPATR